MGCCKSKEQPHTNCDMCFKKWDDRHMIFYPFRYQKKPFVMCKKCLDITVENVIIDMFEREANLHKIEERADTPYPPETEPSP